MMAFEITSGMLFIDKRRIDAKTHHFSHDKEIDLVAVKSLRKPRFARLSRCLDSSVINENAEANNDTQLDSSYFEE